MPDSISHNLDSVSQITPVSLSAPESISVPDSLSVLDSLSTQDTLTVIDTLKAIVPPVPPGMEGIALPSVPANENWVFVVLVALFIFLTTGISQSAGTFLRNIKSFISKKEPISLIEKPTANIAYFYIIISIFTVSVFALMFYEAVFKETNNFSFKSFLIFAAAFAVYYIVKIILFDIVGNTFFNRKITRNYKNMYFSLLNVLAILIFPLVILYTYQPLDWKNTLIIMSLVFIGVFYIFLIIKIFQLFFTKPIALFYIFLYLCTLEILPILLLLRLNQKLILFV